METRGREPTASRRPIVSPAYVPDARSRAKFDKKRKTRKHQSESYLAVLARSGSDGARVRSSTEFIAEFQIPPRNLETPCEIAWIFNWRIYVERAANVHVSRFIHEESELHRE